MISTTHSIEIDSSKEDAMDMIANVSAWPAVFPPCQRASIIEDKKGRQLIEITALANGVAMTWRSKRVIDLDNNVISFEQVSPSPLLKKMTGEWRFLPTEKGVRVELDHAYEVKNDVSGLVQDVATVEDAEAFILRSVNENSNKELASIKSALENREKVESRMYDFGESVVIDADKADILEILWRAEKWPEVLPHCSGMEVNYDDGFNQELVMTVDVNNEKEVIRTVRHRRSNYSIEYFQPSPPPALKIHTGEWVLEEKEYGVRVSSLHRVVLNKEGVSNLWGDISEDDAYARVKTAINNNSMQTLEQVKSICESKLVN